KLPAPYRLVLSNGEPVAPVRREGHHKHSLVLPEARDHPPLFQMPVLHGQILASGKSVATVTREGDTGQRAVMPFEYDRRARSILERPQAGCLVFAGRERPLTVRRERECGNPAFVSREGVKIFTFLGVPKADDFVATAR